MSSTHNKSGGNIRPIKTIEELIALGYKPLETAEELAADAELRRPWTYPPSIYLGTSWGPPKEKMIAEPKLAKSSQSESEKFDARLGTKIRAQCNQEWVGRTKRKSGAACSDLEGGITGSKAGPFLDEEDSPSNLSDSDNFVALEKLGSKEMSCTRDEGSKGDCDPKEVIEIPGPEKLRGGDQEVVLAQYGSTSGYVVRVGDYERLFTDSWKADYEKYLNDVLIDFAVQRMLSRPRGVHFFSTFFTTKLMGIGSTSGYNTKSVERWLKKLPDDGTS